MHTLNLKQDALGKIVEFISFLREVSFYLPTVLCKSLTNARNLRQIGARSRE